jgi:formylglycine-generating enzyme required for sulfatase activity
LFLQPVGALAGSGLTLSLERAADQIVLKYGLPATNGTIAIYQGESVGGSDSWPLTQVVPVFTKSFGQLKLPRSQAQQFFRVTFYTNSAFGQMLWIPPGTFVMGSADFGRTADDYPPRPVTVAAGFWISKFELTQKEYASPLGTYPSQGKGGPTAPVDTVRWFDATNYCGRLTASESAAGRLPSGYVYRLPTEAEWEYACRAGTQTQFSFGDDLSQLSNYAWWSENGGPWPHAVGKKLPNPWGLYDMHGNVFEWCLDSYLPYPGSTITLDAGERVLRSGSFYCPPMILRSSCRNHSASPDDATTLIGFRVVLGRPVAVP